MDANAPWRRLLPTDKQLDALRRCGLVIRPGLTRGQAAEMLTAAFAQRPVRPKPRYTASVPPRRQPAGAGVR